MRFFKHGDSLAIVLPDKFRRSSDVKEDEDYEFFEAERGTFILINRKNLEDLTRKSVMAELLKGNKPETKQNETQQTPAETAEPEKVIFSNGFVVISSEEEARRISKLFEKQIKANELMGIRGFDKKFYIVTAPFFRQNSVRILKLIGSRDMSLKDISFSLKLDENGCNACLQLLKEQGEVIEKRKGLFKVIK